MIIFLVLHRYLDIAAVNAFGKWGMKGISTTMTGVLKDGNHLSLFIDRGLKMHILFRKQHLSQIIHNVLFSHSFQGVFYSFYPLRCFITAHME